jgi:arsenate reductase-like glutaredoxin family protein
MRKDFNVRMTGLNQKEKLRKLMLESKSILQRPLLIRS